MANPFNPRDLGIRARKSHPLEWLLEPLEDHAGYFRKRMFGGEAIYMSDRLTLMLTAGDEPWNGLLIVTGREFHAALIGEWKSLVSHEVLGKWLYLSQNHAAFESTATAIIRAIRRGDPRIGIDPKPRTPRAKKKNKITGKGAKSAKKK